MRSDEQDHLVTSECIHVALQLSNCLFSIDSVYSHSCINELRLRPVLVFLVLASRPMACGCSRFSSSPEASSFWCDRAATLPPARVFPPLSLSLLANLTLPGGTFVCCVVWFNLLICAAVKFHQRDHFFHYPGLAAFDVNWTEPGVVKEIEERRSSFHV